MWNDSCKLKDRYRSERSLGSGYGAFLSKTPPGRFGSLLFFPGFCTDWGAQRVRCRYGNRFLWWAKCNREGEAVSGVRELVITKERHRLHSGLLMEETGSEKSSPTLLFQRRGYFFSPFAKGGQRGIFFDQLELFLRSEARQSKKRRGYREITDGGILAGICFSTTKVLTSSHTRVRNSTP